MWLFSDCKGIVAYGNAPRVAQGEVSAASERWNRRMMMHKIKDISLSKLSLNGFILTYFFFVELQYFLGAFPYP